MPSSNVAKRAAAPLEARPIRRKTSEACERCREKRIKCNGFHPCEQCMKKGVQCVFAFAPSTSVARGNEALGEKLDLILSRLDGIEEELCRQANVLADNSGQANKRPQYPSSRRSNGIAQLNQQTGCFEYYGQTSAFTIASSLGKELGQLVDISHTENLQTTRHQTDSISDNRAPADKGSGGLVLDELSGFCDLVVPLNALRTDRYLHDEIADRHIESFFQTIHALLPILSPDVFKGRYRPLRRLFGDRRLSLSVLDDPTRPQFVCLMYAVLALGALYEDKREDSSSWASWYFAEAQDMLGRLLNASNLHLIQASVLLGAYAQHAIKSNLAYILNGVATRLAFSTGLNIESLHTSLGIDTQEARRTWWVIYIQEVELSLDSGRPMCLRSSEMNMTYPKSQLPPGGEVIPEPSQVMFISLLAEIAKIIRRIMDLSTEAIEPDAQDTSEPRQRKELLRELETWRASLPGYLDFKDATENSNDHDALTPLHTWESRQQSSLQIPTLVILLKVVHDHHGCRRMPNNPTSSPPSTRLHRDDITENIRLCNLAVEVFEQIKMKASQRCAVIVRNFLDKWAPEQEMKNPDTRHLGSSLDDSGKQQKSSPTITFWLSLDDSRATNEMQENSGISSDDARADPVGDETVGSNDSTTARVSLSALQAELHDAFYGEMDENFHFAPQPSLFDIDAFGDYVLGTGADRVGATDGTWHPCNGMPPDGDDLQPV